MKIELILLSLLGLAFSAPIVPQSEQDGIVDVMESQSSSESTIIKADESVHDLTSDEDPTTASPKTSTNVNNHTWECAENAPCYVSSKNCKEDCESGLIVVPTGEKQTQFEIYMKGPQIGKESVIAMEYKNNNNVHTFKCIPALREVQDEIIKSENELQFISGRETSHSISCKFIAHVFHDFNNTNDQYNILLGNLNGGKWNVTDSRQVQKQQSFIGGRFEKFDTDKEAVEIVKKAERKIMEDFLLSGTEKARGADELISEYEKEFEDLQKKKAEAEEKRNVEVEKKKKADAEEKKKKTDAEEKKKKTDAEEKKKAKLEAEEKREAEEKKKLEENKKLEDEEKKALSELKNKAAKKSSKSEKKIISAEIDEEGDNSEIEEEEQKVINKKVSKSNVGRDEKKEESNEPKMRSSDDDDDEDEKNNEEYDEESDEPNVRTEEKTKSERDPKKERELFDRLLKKDKKIVRDEDEILKGDADFMAPDSSSLAPYVSAFIIALIALMF